MNTSMNEWQLYLCRTSFCRADHWLVRESQDQPELWHVASTHDGAPWLVAATEPACPFCGAVLQAAALEREDMLSDLAA